MQTLETAPAAPEGQSVELKSWAYPHVIEALLKLAQEGGVDLQDPDTLLKVSRTQAWSVAEVFPREGKMNVEGHDKKILKKEVLEPLIFGFDDVINGIPAGVRDRIFELLDIEQMRTHAEGNLKLSSAASKLFGYQWLEQRSTMARFLHIIANKIQDPKFQTGAYDRPAKDPSDGSFSGSRKAAEELILSLYGYGWEKEDPDLQKAIERFELQLGTFWCVQMLGLLKKHDLDPIVLTRNGHKKYGIPDQDDINSCYWCGGCPCTCEGRWEKMKFERADRTAEDVWNYGLPEMDKMMWVAYGGSRNSSFSPLMGVVRSLSEGGGEEAFVEIMIELGSSLETYRKKMGSLFQDTRHVLDRKDKQRDAIKKYRKDNQLDDTAVIPTETMTEIEEKVLREQLYAEAADAAISWPCLVAQSFGLNFTRAVKRALKYMAEQSGTKLTMPEDISQTVRAD